MEHVLPESVVVESKDEFIKDEAKKMIIELVERVERKMGLICDNCLKNIDFIEKQRLDVYIKALEETQDEIGIVVNKESQRKAILGKG